MRLENVYVRGTGLRLPDRLSVAGAVATGACDRGLAVSADIVSVAYSPVESAAEMAVAAARQAMRHAAIGPRDIDLLLHADASDQGRERWPVAPYIQREMGGGPCPALEIRQRSNGGMAALDLAAAYLSSPRGYQDALLTTADRCGRSGMDRWCTEPGAPYADGATALVLSRRGGYARLCSLSVFADPELEPTYGDARPPTSSLVGQPVPQGVPSAWSALSADRPAETPSAVGRARSGQRTVLTEALADADLELAEADWVVLPHFGRGRLESVYYRPFGIDPARTTWEWSRTVGHLGAGDQFAGLHHLVRSGLARPGQRLVLVGVGAGYSWGCAVIEMLA